MAQIANGGGETAAERNARLQAAFNATSTTTPTTTSTYVPAPPATPAPAPAQDLDQRLYSLPQFGTPPPSVPQLSQEATTLLQQTANELGFNTFGTTATGPTVTSRRDEAYTETTQQSTWQRSIDFVNQGSTQTYEDALVASAARLTGEAIFQYGQIPNVISTTVANQLPYTYYGYSSADQFLEDLGYFEQAPGQWIQGEGGGTTTTTTGGGGGSATTSYRRAITGGGYTGRYAGASTGLINWRIGF